MVYESDGVFLNRVGALTTLENLRRQNSLFPGQLERLNELHRLHAKNWSGRNPYDASLEPPFKIGDIVRTHGWPHRLYRVAGMGKDTRFDSGYPGGWDARLEMLDHDPISPDQKFGSSWCYDMYLAPLDALAWAATTEPILYLDSAFYMEHFSPEEHETFMRLAMKQAKDQASAEERADLKALIQRACDRRYQR